MAKCEATGTRYGELQGTARGHHSLLSALSRGMHPEGLTNAKPETVSSNTVETLVKSLEELLVAPVTPSSEGLYQLIPCGHCHSRLTWMEHQELEKNYCPVCSKRVEGTGPLLPVGTIGDVLEELKEECRNMEKVEKYEFPTRPSTLQERRLSITKSVDSSRSTFRERMSDLPSRIFKRSDSMASDVSISSRRSSMTNDSTRSLLRVTSETEEVRGAPTSLI